MTEHGRTVLYETTYRGIEEESGKVRLLAYFGKRAPLTGALPMKLPGPAGKMKDAA